jgi:hypothetical protein
MLALFPPDLFNLGAVISISAILKVRPLAMQFSADWLAVDELILFVLVLLN